MTAPKFAWTEGNSPEFRQNIAGALKQDGPEAQQGAILLEVARSLDLIAQALTT